MTTDRRFMGPTGKLALMLHFYFLFSTVQGRAIDGCTGLDVPIGQQLSKWIRPKHYELLVKPDLDKLTFSGKVTIHVDITDDEQCNNEPKKFGCNRQQIVLNANPELDVDNVVYKSDGGIKVSSICRDPKNELIVISLSDKLKAGSSGQLTMEFANKFKSNVNGFYKSPYVNSRSERASYGATQFEMTHARDAFPCFDEPSFKATFGVIIEHDARLSALSNMDLIKREKVAGDASLSRSIFATTPVMSTYLLAYAVGEFDTIESNILGGKMTIRAHNQPGKISLSKQSLDIASQVFIALNNWFKIDQPIHKADLVPFEHEVGAMENWGLVTFAEHLFNRAGGTMPWIKLRSTLTIAHEFAHFWFGNLVTMKWWDDLWLKEAFAEFMAYEISNEIWPEEGFDLYYLEENHIAGLAKDANGFNSHPIRMEEMNNPKEIHKVFDDITYKKGSALIRMFSSYLGKDNFKNAMRMYMDRHKFGNTGQNDMYKVIEEVSGKPFVDMAGSWLNEEGYPIVSVKFTGKDRKKVSISQKSVHGDDTKWIIPISMIVSNGAKKTETLRFVLDQTDHMEVKLPSWFDGHQTGSWLKLNDNFEGFYQVMYDPETLDLLDHPIKSKQMSPANRYSALNSLELMMSHGKLAPRDYVGRLVNWFKQEDSSVIMSRLSTIAHKIESRKNEPTNNPIVSLLINYYQRIGGYYPKSKESLADQHFNNFVISTLIYFNYKPAIEEGIEVVKLIDSKNWHGDRLESVLAAVAKGGNEDHFAKACSIQKRMENDARSRSWAISRAFKNVDSDDTHFCNGPWALL